jgi:hypothetical protein
VGDSQVTFSVTVMSPPIRYNCSWRSEKKDKHDCHPTFKDDAMDNDNVRNRGARRAGVLAVMAAGAVLATACGGSSPSFSTGGSASSGGSANYQKALAYSECMRGRGVVNFPDPDAQGNIIQHVGPGQPADDSSVEQAADKTCRHLLPGGGAPLNPQSQVVKRYLKFAQCMRTHGVPNYPDPKVSPGVFDSGLNGFNINSPQFKAAERACKSLIPPSMLPGS